MCVPCGCVEGITGWIQCSLAGGFLTTAPPGKSSGSVFVTSGFSDLCCPLERPVALAPACFFLRLADVVGTPSPGATVTRPPAVRRPALRHGGLQTLCLQSSCWGKADERNMVCVKVCDTRLEITNFRVSPAGCCFIPSSTAQGPASAACKVGNFISVLPPPRASVFVFNDNDLKRITCLKYNEGFFSLQIA